MQAFVPVVDKKHPLRCAVYDRFMRRNPLKTKLEVYNEIAEEFGISVSTVQRYLKTVESGVFIDESKKQGRHVYAWDDEALSFFTNFYLAAMAEVGGCTVRNAYEYTKKRAEQMGWRIGSEQSAYTHAKKISPAMIMLAKGGQRALDNMFYISRDLSKLKPFQLIVGDQHRFDFWCLADDGKTFIRAECYLWLDMATRVVYGVSFDPHYNTRTVTRALRMGIQRFGKFESTYNDNGSSEKSALSTQIVQALQSYGVKFIDEADLYHADNGRYIVEDTEGCVVDVVKTKAEWEKQHRRIFARVKNAKTKPIERFFNTLEQILRDLCIPGYVKEMGMSAPEEEQADKRLKWQKKNGYILTYDEFIKKVAQALDIYENRRHATLGCTPKERLEEYRLQGWMPTYIDPRDEAYLFMESAFATVKGDRVRLNNIDYVGPELTQEMILQNRGTLVAYNRQKIELRYDPENLDIGVFAIEPGTHNAIALHPVEKINMLDDEAMVKSLEWKNRNITAVKKAFENATKDKSIRVLSEPQKFQELRNSEKLAEQAMALEAPKEQFKPTPVIRKADQETEEFALPQSRKRNDSYDSAFIPQTFKSESEMSDEEFMQGLVSRISSENILRSHSKDVFMTGRDRYQSILERYLNGERLNREDLDFKFFYEGKMTPSEENYFAAFTKNNFNRG